MRGPFLILVSFSLSGKMGWIPFTMSKRQQAAEAALQDQENILPKKQLLITFSVLAIGYLFYFLDQNGIGQLLPTVARELKATDTISWAAASALTGNTTFQVRWPIRR